MKRAVFFLISALSVFAFSFTMTRFFEKPSSLFKMGTNAPSPPSSYALKNRSFTIVVVGYNNGAFIEKTLNSLLCQNYDPFRLVYIDDASDDGSFEVARDAIYNSDRIAHVTLVKNEEKLGELANVYRAVQACPDDEIVIVLDPNDWLAHEWVLQRLNAYYENPSTWMCLAKKIDYPSYEWSFSKHFKGERSHLKSFYAALFKKIRESDFIYSGKFLPLGAELAYMTPMLEMAQNHLQFVPEVLCVNLKEKKEMEDRELMQSAEKKIRSLEPYTPLTLLELHPCVE